jgi:hypothetical protein
MATLDSWTLLVGAPRLVLQVGNIVTLDTSCGQNRTNGFVLPLPPVFLKEPYTLSQISAKDLVCLAGIAREWADVSVVKIRR